MAEIIHFPLKPDPRAEALQRLALKLVAYLSTSFYRKGILDLPIQAFVKDMYENMLEDGIDYNPVLLDSMGDDLATLQRIELMFIKSLIKKGFLPENFVDLKSE